MVALQLGIKGSGAMLVLSRKENETIEFPALGVVIRLFGLSRRRVQVGIEAPISLQVTRGEKSGPAAPSGSIDSVAEHVIGEEFCRLEAELAALAELAGQQDRPLAQDVAGDAIERMSRIRKTLVSALRRQERKFVAAAPEGSPVDTESSDSGSRQAVSHGHVRQTTAGYEMTETAWDTEAVSPLPSRLSAAAELTRTA